VNRDSLIVAVRGIFEYQLASRFLLFQSCLSVFIKLWMDFWLIPLLVSAEILESFDSLHSPNFLAPFKHHY